MHDARCNAIVRPRDLEIRKCPYCGQQFKPLRSHPHQMVCSSGDCQRRRRADYHRKKLKKDPLYRALCQDSQETWLEQNPEYMKRYRAGQREAKPDRTAVDPLVIELKRLLTCVKNNLVKNTSAILVTRCAPNIWVLAPKRKADDKNTSAPTHVVVIHGLAPDA